MTCHVLSCHVMSSLTSSTTHVAASHTMSCPSLSGATLFLARSVDLQDVSKTCTRPFRGLSYAFLSSSWHSLLWNGTACFFLTVIGSSWHGIRSIASPLAWPFLYIALQFLTFLTMGWHTLFLELFGFFLRVLDSSWQFLAWHPFHYFSTCMAVACRLHGFAMLCRTSAGVCPMHPFRHEGLQSSSLLALLCRA